MTDLVLSFASCLVISLVFVPILLKFAFSWQTLDHPDHQNDVDVVKNKSSGPRRIHSRAVPHLGGVAIFFSFLIAMFFWQPDPVGYWLIWASVPVFTLGLVDDLYHLSAKLRLIVQIIAAGFAVYAADLSLTQVCLIPGTCIDLPLWLGAILSVFIIVGAINALNMVDGLDGLAGGLVIIALVLLSFMQFIRYDSMTPLLILSLPLIGSILGFLRYNTHPALIFMGDSGSNWLGFMIGGILLMSLKQDRQIAISMPFLSAIMCLAIPVIDTAMVIIARIAAGQNPMKADNRHFHHALLRIGLTHSQTVTAIYFIALVFGVLGTVPISFMRYQVAWIPFLAAIVLILSMSLGVFAGGKILERLVSSRSRILKENPISHRLRGLLRVWENAIRYSIYFILLMSPLCAGIVGKEIGYIALVFAALLLMVTLFQPKQQDFMESFFLSCALAVLLLAINQKDLAIELFATRYSVHFIYNALFNWLLFGTIGFVFLTLRKRYFLISPSDFLVLALPLLLLLAPEPWYSQYKLNIIALRCLVFFMSVRLLIKRRPTITHRIRMVTIVSLTYIALTSLAGLRFIYHT
jgi:UDP-GlcNAc:undecaprenyl-phosphate/decaprenyl-phosphate GlcNAc-1-phosphate transferase